MTREHLIPSKVREALDHVRRYRPDIVQVVFTITGHWLFLTAEGKAPALCADVNVSLLEDAQRWVDDNCGLPQVYAFAPRTEPVTVRELIAQLREQPADALVFLTTAQAHASPMGLIDGKQPYAQALPGPLTFLVLEGLQLTKTVY